jgi:hypothetical protein
MDVTGIYRGGTTIVQTNSLSLSLSYMRGSHAVPS